MTNVSPQLFAIDGPWQAAEESTFTAWKASDVGPHGTNVVRGRVDTKHILMACIKVRQDTIQVNKHHGALYCRAVDFHCCLVVRSLLTQQANSKWQLQEVDVLM